MNSKILFFVAFIAVFAGLLGAANNYLTTAQTAHVDPTANVLEKPTMTYTVWRAKHTLEKGKAIHKSDLVRDMLDEQAAHAVGINQNITLDFDSKTLLNTTIEQGALVLPEHQVTPNEAGYLTLITRDGMTLYPLEINTQNLIENYIQAGDDIDILAISSPAENLTSATTRINHFNKVHAHLFMQQLRVINIDNGSQPSAEPNTNNGIATKTTVILEVHPNDVAKLALAQRTMYLEIYRSQQYQRKPDIHIHDVIRNYNGVVELRG